MEKCTLHDVLLVPDLAYNLLSVTSASKKGKVTTFSKMRCEIRDAKSKLIASGCREGSLYYLDHGDPVHQAFQPLITTVRMKPSGIAYRDSRNASTGKEQNGEWVGS